MTASLNRRMLFFEDLIDDCSLLSRVEIAYDLLESLKSAFSSSTNVFDNVLVFAYAIASISGRFFDQRL